jgi:hypothetical protein
MGRRKGWDVTDLKLLPVLALLPLFFAPAPLALAQDGAQCAAIASDAERLACYDGLFRSAAPASDFAAVARLESDQLIPARPSGRAPATMTVMCEDSNLSIAFAFAGNTMSALGRDAGITLQYDLQAARSRTLLVNSENTAIIMTAADGAEAFLQGLEGATNLTVRVTPVNSRSLSVRFRVDAFMAEVAPVRAACN